MELLGKIPPQSIEFEEAVLGAIMREPAGLDDIAHKLKPESFYKEVHSIIYKSIITLYKKNSEIDILTVAEELRKTSELENVGGPLYITQLSSKVSSSAHLEYHTMIVIQKYMAREMIRIGSEIEKNSFDESLDVSDIIEKAEKDIFAINQDNIKTEPIPISEALDSRIKEITTNSKIKGDIIGIPTGIKSIDRVTGGWLKPDLIILAARPSVGKTAFALQCTRSSAKSESGVGFFSLEMSTAQLIDRFISFESDCTPTEIRNARNITVDEIIIAANKLPLNIIIDDTPALSVYEFRSKARRLKTKYDIELIIVDYLQLMRGSEDNRGNRVAEVSEISRILKATAKELNVPIIALSQLNRDVEKRGGDGRPKLSDLRESGSIEQDADIVIFLHRPEEYGMTEDENGNSMKNVVEFIIAKNRNGATAELPLITNDSCTSWNAITNENYTGNDISYPDEWLND